MKKAGFTLIELMVVVIIIAALAGMVLPHVIGRADDAKGKIAAGDLGHLKTALSLYRLDNGTYPTTDEGLMALMVAPASASNWKEPYLEKSPNDPWGRPYKYQYKGSHNVLGFDLWSDGPDVNTPDDDVTNWDSK
jgi:general secretion pathway protein G